MFLIQTNLILNWNLSRTLFVNLNLFLVIHLGGLIDVLLKPPQPTKKPVTLLNINCFHQNFSISWDLSHEYSNVTEDTALRTRPGHQEDVSQLWSYEAGSVYPRYIWQHRMWIGRDGYCAGILCRKKEVYSSRLVLAEPNHYSRQ